MRTKQEVIDFLESQVGKTIPCKGNPQLDGMCVTLIKAVMEFLEVPDPYKARGHAKTCISAYLNEGIAKEGSGFLSVFSNKNMGDGYGHIWCNAGDGTGTYYESNGAKPLVVTKGKTYSYDMVCNFDQYINLKESANTSEKTYTQEEWQIERDERNKNWDLYQTQLTENNNLKSQVSVKDETIKTLTDNHQKFIEFVITKISPLTSFIDNSEEAAKTSVLNIVSLVDELNKTIKTNIEKAEKNEQELVKKNEDLQTKLDTLQKQFDKLKEDHQLELDRMQERIDKVQAQVDANNEKQAQNESFKSFINKIISVFKKG